MDVGGLQLHEKISNGGSVRQYTHLARAVGGGCSDLDAGAELILFHCTVAAEARIVCDTCTQAILKADCLGIREMLVPHGAAVIVTAPWARDVEPEELSPAHRARRRRRRCAPGHDSRGGQVSSSLDGVNHHHNLPRRAFCRAQSDGERNKRPSCSDQPACCSLRPN